MQSKCHSLMIFATICLIAPASARADLIVTPGFSRVSSYARVGAGEITDIDDQLATLTSLSSSAFASESGLNLSNNAVANWNSANQGSVTLNYLRENGQSIFISGESRFRYDFTISEATELVIDYDFTGTTTSSSSNGTVNWWAMQGYQIVVDGQSDHFNFSVVGGLPNNLPSPIAFTGQLVYALDPGSHQLELTLFGGASGDFPGTRNMFGGIDFQIGQTAVPEPASAMVCVPVLSAMLFRRRKR